VFVVLGASYIDYEDWISTDLPHFNVCKESDWKSLLADVKSDRLLSEHVFEHLTYEQVRIAVRLSYKYLKQGGVLRIAMPDEWNPDQYYYESTKIGGRGYGAEDHYSMWNIESLTQLLQAEGFEVTPLEYWTRERKLVTVPFSDAEGPIRRSIQRTNKVGEIENYTSLIVDALKK
jgi:predicted SAM-dependent methyltransferase